MSLSFSCPSCGLKGRADAAYAGRQVRCKQCQYQFPIPDPAKVEIDGYALDGPAPVVALDREESSPQGSVFTANRNDESSTLTRRPPLKRTVRKKPGRNWGDFPWRLLLIWGSGGLAVTLVLVALLAPNGLLLAGLTLIILGMLMMTVGYLAGVFGAFSEDLLYGMLFLFIPLYSAYYVVTRWDDLWRWVLCSTAGLGLIVLGTQLVQWAGLEV